MTTAQHLSSYPVFIMHEQLNLNGLLDGESLDIQWELSCNHYADFKKSDYNDDNQSEYDCIRKYVINLMKSYND